MLAYPQSAGIETGRAVAHAAKSLENKESGSWHHASRDLYVGGYRYFGNAALTVAKRLRRQGQVAIIGIDFHHGVSSWQWYPEHLLSRPESVVCLDPWRFARVLPVVLVVWAGVDTFKEDPIGSFTLETAD